MAFPVFRFFLFSLSHQISFRIPIQGVLSSVCDQWKCGTRKNNRAIFYYFLLIWQNTYLLKAKWLWNVLNATLCYVKICALRAYGVYYPNKISLNHILNTPLKVLARVMFLMCHDLWCAPSLPFFPILFDRFTHFVSHVCRAEQNFNFRFNVRRRWFRFVFISIHSCIIADLAHSSMCSGLYSFVYVCFADLNFLVCMFFHASLFNYTRIQIPIRAQTVSVYLLFDCNTDSLALLCFREIVQTIPRYLRF